MSEALVVADTSEVEAQVAPVIRAADALVVRSVDDHRNGLEMLGAVMAAERKVKAFFAPMLEAAQETKRKAEAGRLAVVNQQEIVLGPVMQARKTITEKCGAFEAEERRVAALNQARINAEALAKQEQERILDAAMADTEEEAEEALTVPLAPPVVPIVRPEVAKVAGVSARETWSAEITDKAAFLAWAAKPENNYTAEPNMTALNSRARAEKGSMQIPGVKAVSKLSYAGR